MRTRICKQQRRGKLAKVETTYTVEVLEKRKEGFWRPKEVEEWRVLKDQFDEMVCFPTLKEARTVTKNLKEDCLSEFLMVIVEETN